MLVKFCLAELFTVCDRYYNTLSISCELRFYGASPHHRPISCSAVFGVAYVIALGYCRGSEILCLPVFQQQLVKNDKKTADATVYLRGITRKSRLLQVLILQKSRSKWFLLLLGNEIGLAEGENKNQISRLPGFCQDKFSVELNYIIHHKALKLEVLSFWVANF